MHDRDPQLGFYQKELDDLLRLGAQFQADYPGVASHLRLDQIRDDDPHVARLLEGFAFLAGRIRAKLDDEFPELTEALLEVLYPQLLRSFPSAAIVQFGRRPHGGAAAGTREIIPAGTPLRAIHPEYRDCRFRTVYPVEITPWEVVAAQFETERIPLPDRRRGDQALLRLTLAGEAPGGVAAVGLDRLRFHLAGEDRVAFALHELIGSAITRVELRTTPPGVDGHRASVVLGPRAVTPVGFDAGEGMVPYPRRVPRGYRFIQEYCAFPRKFLFFDLVDLKSAAETLGAATTWEILLFFGRTPPEDLAVEARHVRLGCTPVVNLFNAPAVPIRLTRTRTRYPVVPDLPGAEVFRIERVAGARAELHEPIEYRPLLAYRPDDNDRSPPFWQARRLPVGPKGSTTMISFVDGDADPCDVTGEEVVAVSLTCTNGTRPFGMPTDRRGGDFEPEGPVACGPVRCLTPPTRPIDPPGGRGALWRLVSNLSLNSLSLVVGDDDGGDDGPPASARDALVELLQSYNAADDRAVRDRLSGIAAVSGRHVIGPRPGGSGAVGGVEVAVRFDEARFLGQGSFLLETVLDRFFGLYVSINSFSRLVVLDEEGRTKRRWPPRSGAAPLL